MKVADGNDCHIIITKDISLLSLFFRMRIQRTRRKQIRKARGKRGWRMRHPTKDGDKVFEVAIYNKDVRSLVKDNQSHTFFDDNWADAQVHDVVARDEDTAREMIAERFPPDDGFVIQWMDQTN